jgi:hypothetical protein
MTQASNGYCSDFPPPTTPFSGTAFFGRFAETGGRYGNSYTSGNGSSSGTSGTTSTSPYNNPTLYAAPPQAPATTNGNGGTGNGNKPPAGFGNGHQPSSGGAGVKHH